MKSNRARVTSQDKGIIRSNVLFMVLGMVLMVPLIILKPVLARRAASEKLQKQAPIAQPPWGDLEYRHFTLERPDQYLPNSTDALPAAEWHFEKTTPEQLTALFNSVETTAGTRQLLLDASRWQVSSDSVIVRPTLELLLHLGRAARERIYAVLGNSPVNMPQYYPFRVGAESFDQWFAQSRFAPEKLALIRSLTYTNRGGSICLADLDVLQVKLGREDFRRLFESLYSEQSLFLSLRVTPSTDFTRLAQYWGIGGRHQEVLALLRSIVKSGGGNIDVAHLLPQFARLRLYRFSAPETDSDANQDCFWTALNFFRTESQAQNSSGNRSLEMLMTTHAETIEPPRFGDVIVFVENRKPVHACVYIADDVVFTKNGVNHHQPWVLMKLNDVIPRYATDRPMSMVVLRQKTT